MKRVCVHKVTKHIIEMQSGGIVARRAQITGEATEEYAKYLSDCDNLETMRLDTLRQNAVNSGYPDADIEVKWVSSEEYETLKATDPVEIAVIAAKEEAMTTEATITQEVASKLPSWATVEKAVNDISSLPEAKAFILKLARVTYLHVKGKAI